MMVDGSPLLYGTCAFCDALLWPGARPSQPRQICDSRECKSKASAYGSARARALYLARLRAGGDHERVCPRCPDGTPPKPLDADAETPEQRAERLERQRLTSERYRRADPERFARQMAESRARRSADPVRLAAYKWGTTSRTLYAWRRGERETVRFDVADAALTGAGLLPWDVWSDPDVLQLWNTGR